MQKPQSKIRQIWLNAPIPKCSNVQPPKHIRPPYVCPKIPCGAESFGWRVSLHMARWQEGRGARQGKASKGENMQEGELPAGRYSRFSERSAAAGTAWGQPMVAAGQCV